MIIELKCECKRRADTKLRLKLDISVKLRNDVVSNDKSEANSLRIHLLRILDEAKELEQFVLVLVADSYASILHGDLYLVVLVDQVGL